MNVDFPIWENPYYLDLKRKEAVFAINSKSGCGKYNCRYNQYHKRFNHHN